MSCFHAISKPNSSPAYPPQARALVVAHLDALQQLPLSFVPSLLREVIDYDYKFPAERVAIDRELANLSSLSPAQMTEWFHAFSQFSLSPKLGEFRLDQSAGPVCRTAIGILVDDSPVGWLSQGRDRLWRSFAGGRSRPKRFLCAGSALRSSVRASPPTMRRCFATCARTAPILRTSSRTTDCNCY